MNWKGIFPAIWRAIKPVAPALIQATTTAAGVPMVGTFLNAALYARRDTGKGQQIDLALYVAGVFPQGDALTPPTREVFDQAVQKALDDEATQGK